MTLPYRVVGKVPFRFGTRGPWRHPIYALQVLRMEWLRKHNPAKARTIAGNRIASDLDKTAAKLATSRAGAART